MSSTEQDPMSETTENPHRVLWGAGTPRTMRAHWILQELGLSYERHPFGPRTGETQTAEFTRLNPAQKIPVLQDGDFTLTESAAIVTYAGEKYGAPGTLVPLPGTQERARYYQWCFFVMTELDAHTLYIVRKHTDLSKIFGEAPAAVQAAKEGFKKQVGVADLTLSSGRPFILGETFTSADILLTTCLASAVRREISLSDILRNYLEKMTSRTGYQRAYQANQVS
jgi:glutathione S-transferase